MNGLTEIAVARPDEVGPAWDRALAADRPVVIDALCDPDVPPLPPHITFEQAKGYLSSIFKGDPNLMGMTKQSFKQMTANFLSRNE